MLNIYKRVEKSIDNNFGIVDILNGCELSKPFLLCISAQDNIDRSIYGIIKEGAYASRVCTTEGEAAGFKIDEMPVDFLGVRFKRDDKYKNNYEEIFDTFVSPYLFREGKESIDELKKRARNMNFMTYCDGTITYKGIEKCIEEKLLSMGYSEIDINDILSQISLTAVATMVSTKDVKATTTTFIDVNDEEIETELTNGYKRILEESKMDSFYGTYGKNTLYIFNGSGKHKLKEYLSNESIVKVALSSVVSKTLENSVRNNREETLSPISTGLMLETLDRYTDPNKSVEEGLKKLDSSLSYNHTPRYSVGELALRKELDDAYRKLGLANIQNERLVKDNKEKDTKLNSVVDNLKRYSSDTTFYQVLVSSGMWQPPIGRDVTSELSDRQVREVYEKELERKKERQIYK